MSEFPSEPLPSTSTYPAPASAPAVAAGYGGKPLPQDEYDVQPPLSQGQRVLDTYLAPSKTFADLRRNRSWWLPFLLMAVMGMLFGGVAMKRVGANELAENAMRANPAQAEKMQNASPEQRASILRVTTVSMEVGLLGGPVWLLLWSALVALLLWVGFNFILGGSSTYPGMFAVAMYAALPGVLAYLLMIVMLFVGDPETFNIATPLGTNPGYYLPATTAPVLKSLLTSFDLFTLWSLVLYGLGGAIVARVKQSTGLVMVFAVWLVLVLAKAGIAAATS